MTGEKPTKIRVMLLLIYIIIAAGCAIAGYFVVPWAQDKWDDFFAADGQQKHSSAGSSESPGEDGSALLSEKPGFKHESIVVNGLKQEVYILEIQPETRFAVNPVLARDSIFGFESTSSMAKRINAYAAVNGGFFHQYGQPAGLVVVNGRVLMRSSGRYPVLASRNDGSFYLGELAERSIFAVPEAEFDIDLINTAPTENSSVLFTPEYGPDNGFYGESVNITVKEGKIAGVERAVSPTDIPRDGFLLTLTGNRMPYAERLKAGIMVKIETYFTPGSGGIRSAYECGSWVVRNGAVVVKENDEWVGLTTNRDPRTAVGLKPDGTLILLAVDGRQPGYSHGMTGKELGEYLINLGVADAAMLDGGASTTMVVGDEVVNRPSFMGRERVVGGALAIAK